MYEFWRGESEIDGMPIKLCVSFVSRNLKTGPSIQTWILRSDMTPIEAVKTKADRAICGDCPLRHNLGGACYVLPWQAPTQIYNAKEKMPHRNEVLACRFIRLGSYGDPAAVPEHVWGELFILYPMKIIGYTHQWKNPKFSWLSQICMASTHTAKETLKANSLGWKAYQTVSNKSGPTVDAMQCPTGSGITCSECFGCDATKNIFIHAHGVRKSFFDL